jgi:hypothetical protein
LSKRIEPRMTFSTSALIKRSSAQMLKHHPAGRQRLNPSLQSANIVADGGSDFFKYRSAAEEPPISQRFFLRSRIQLQLRRQLKTACRREYRLPAVRLRCPAFLLFASRDPPMPEHQGTWPRAKGQLTDFSICPFRVRSHGAASW